jgi:AcrR family transcriptional regulator
MFTPSTPSTSDTKIIEVAITLFGEKGLKATGIREIAKAAHTQISAISYHFGSKEALYLDCARYIAKTMGMMLSPALAEADALCAADGDPQSASAALLAIFDHLVAAMVMEETAPFSRFIAREQMEPSQAFDIIYGSVMGDLLARIANLLVVTSGGLLSLVEAKVRAMALMGQVLAFRIARAAVLRSTGWTGIGDAEIQAIAAAVQAHLSAILGALMPGKRL